MAPNVPKSVKQDVLYGFWRGREASGLPLMARPRNWCMGVNLYISGTAPRNLCVGIDKAGYIFT